MLIDTLITLRIRTLFFHFATDGNANFELRALIKYGAGYCDIWVKVRRIQRLGIPQMPHLISLTSHISHVISRGGDMSDGGAAVAWYRLKVVHRFLPILDLPTTVRK